MVFIDESGKSGTMRWEKNTWNDGGCPYLVMAAVVVPDKKVHLLDKEIDSLMKIHRIQGKELKSTHKSVMQHQADIMNDLAEFFSSENVLVFSEVSNKKYNICMTITDYCVLPYYDFPPQYAFDDETRIIKMTFANFFADNLSNELLGEAVEFFDGNSQDVHGLIDLCRKIIKDSDNGSVSSSQVIKCIEDTIDSVKNWKARGWPVRNLFPLPDTYRGGGSSVSVCPQTNCISNLLTNTPGENMYKLDKMSDLADAIRLNAKHYGEIFRGKKFSLEFCSSRDVKGIQVADFLAGLIRQYIESVLILNTSSPITLPECIRERINIVDTLSGQKKIHPSSPEIKRLFECYNDWKA